MSISGRSPSKSPASSLESLDVDSEWNSPLFSATHLDGTIAGHTDLNTTVVSDTKYPLPASDETETGLDRPPGGQDLSPSSSSDTRRRFGVGSSRHTRTWSTASKATSNPRRATRAVIQDDGDLDVLEDLDFAFPPSPPPAVRHRHNVRKRALSLSGTPVQPSGIHPARSRKISSRSYRRSSGEPRMVQAPICKSSSNAGY
ncbi:hypothetical protein D9611_004566 [Ephemerocybe angulata]|uniref:Uncharacterized protein n=1 Tax=Ephemerocybe angulata TaxID=980116 RepID=A0A8H5F5J0_9AGAR|nr:hypothetical protein D9611_004566 [Tulosesus angulatus]